MGDKHGHGVFCVFLWRTWRHVPKNESEGPTCSRCRGHLSRSCTPGSAWEVAGRGVARESSTSGLMDNEKSRLSTFTWQVSTYYLHMRRKTVSGAGSTHSSRYDFLSLVEKVVLRFKI